MNVLWFVGSLAFLGGMLAGALLYHLLGGSNSERGKLQNQLDDLQNDFKDYQNKVSDHFGTTAHLINKLTDSYRDVHEHMASGAENLCEDEAVKNRLSDALLSSNALLSGNITKRRTERPKAVEQPKDYAPKNAPDEKGTLSEEFGVKSEEKPAAPVVEVEAVGPVAEEKQAS
ncbi:YhcB family protein [Endozoicomonas montiporae]|nr:DUF1043 family protein [Endozoicomonas montiporae]